MQKENVGSVLCATGWDDHHVMRITFYKMPIPKKTTYAVQSSEVSFENGFWYSTKE